MTNLFMSLGLFLLNTLFILAQIIWKIVKFPFSLIKNLIKKGV